MLFNLVYPLSGHLGSLLGLNALPSQNPERARAKRQEQQRARKHRCRLGNNNDQLILNRARGAQFSRHLHHIFH